MKIIYAILLSTALMASAQTKKCGKYQHLEPAPTYFGGHYIDDGKGHLTLVPEPQSMCVDDMHTVTEREWQNLQARLKRLEEKKSRQEFKP